MLYDATFLKSILILFLFHYSINSSVLSAQGESNNRPKASPEWVTSTDLTSLSMGIDLVIDSFGNSYTTGHFSDKIWLEDSLYVQDCGSVPFSKNNYFLSKRDKNGTLLWIRYGIAWARPSKLLLDEAENVYIVGHLWSNSLQLSSTKDSIIHRNKSHLHSNQSTIFICQYNPKGEILRAKLIPSQKGQIPNDCVLDHNDNLFIGGTYSFSSPDATRTIKRSYFLTKFDPLLEVVWTKKGEPVHQSSINAITLDAHSNIYVTGGFINNITFLDKNLKGHHYENTIFIIKYNQEGNIQAVLNPFTSTPSSTGLDLAFDQLQNLYVLIHSQQNKSFLLKLDKNHQQIWSKTIKGHQIINGLLTTKENHVYLFGNGYEGYFESGKHADKNHSYKDYNSHSFFIAKYNNYGNLLGLNIEGKGPINYCKAIALFKDKILVLGTSNSGRELHFGSYIKKVEWYYNIWLAAYLQVGLVTKSQDSSE